LKFRISIVLLFTVVVGFSQHKKAYAVFTDSGKKSNFNKIIKKAVTTDVVLLSRDV